MKIISVLIGTLFVLIGCASSPSPHEVVREVVQGSTKEGGPDSLRSPTYLKLSDLLKQSGYEGIGLQYESETVLSFLYKVFADPRAKNRKIKLVYTGMNLSYDPKYQSLTVPGAETEAQVLAYIDRNIPAK